jgi:hypothetical protein
LAGVLGGRALLLPCIAAGRGHVKRFFLCLTFKSTMPSHQLRRVYHAMHGLEAEPIFRLVEQLLKLGELCKRISRKETVGHIRSLRQSTQV